MQISMCVLKFVYILHPHVKTGIIKYLLDSNKRSSLSSA